MNTTPPAVRLISFGYLHSPPPAADLTANVREALRDPARVAGMLDLTGHHPAVQRAVHATPGARRLLLGLAAHVARQRRDRPLTIAIGCAGGRHRSVALVELLARRLRLIGRAATTEHLHVHLPRVVRDIDGGGAV
ncbi:RapZ C-terminal domain-containing protein [Allonocardiopsis opalescens]|uniref:UPF0042 nucleotide-binding protein n=1 Tax=Allonocardiopsis opalescens TaxID=1144618 RepID=A0A2T0Q9E6_9ACTN|nr:RNase adapter RapZ [Allonocardiopsis opalescens]PRY00430.1 UPF0042 nucleotide-binding protein [Allonocardiopsis opalescens]